MSVPEPVPEIIGLYRGPVLQLQYESTAMKSQFPFRFQGEKFRRQHECG